MASSAINATPSCTALSAHIARAQTRKKLRSERRASRGLWAHAHARRIEAGSSPTKHLYKTQVQIICVHSTQTRRPFFNWPPMRRLWKTIIQNIPIIAKWQLFEGKSWWCCSTRRAQPRAVAWHWWKFKSLVQPVAFMQPSGKTSSQDKKTRGHSARICVIKYRRYQRA